MNRHYPIQGQLAAVLCDEVQSSLDAVARTVFLPNKHGWQKPAADVLGALPRSVFAEIGLDIAWYRHIVVHDEAPPPSDGEERGGGSFAINVVLQGTAEIRWRELGQANARYGERQTFIMDTSAPHAIAAIGGDMVMGSFTPASAMTYEDAMFQLRNWIRSRQA